MYQLRSSLLLLGCAAFILDNPALAQVSPPQAPPPGPQVRAARATGAIALDGKLDEKDWQAAQPAVLKTLKPRAASLEIALLSPFS